MNDNDRDKLYKIINYYGAYEILWRVSDWMETEWPESPVAKISPTRAKEAMKDCAYGIKHEANVLLYSMNNPIKKPVDQNDE